MGDCMNAKKFTSEYRLSQWMQVIQERQSSGQSVKDFCQLRGISKNAYYYWQRKLRNTACEDLVKSNEPASLVPNGWIELASEQQMKNSLDIEVNGCRISVDADTDSELLKRVCGILRAL
jgi:putative transposase